MIDRRVFSVEVTAELLRRGGAAGKGAQLVIFYESSKDGTGITELVDIQSPDQLAGKADCDEPLNSSHLCPGPLCP